MSGATGQHAASAADRFAAAHRALRGDPSIQFAMERAQSPAPPPHWLIDFFRWLGQLFAPIGRVLRWITGLMPDAPYARIFLWTVLGAIAAMLAWMVYQRLRHGEWRLPRRRTGRSVPVDLAEEQGWAPDAGPVRAWLDEADALAARGRYAEAAHLLLFRSVEDIARRRPRLVRPALTSRELAAADAIPPPARDLFGRIARLVERSLFGGRAVDAGDWSAARAAYADFALPGAWRA